jgi:hypothetical protein
MTRFFRKESFRVACHIQPHRVQHMPMLDVGSLEFEKQGNRRQAKEKKRQQERLKDF